MDIHVAIIPGRRVRRGCVLIVFVRAVATIVVPQQSAAVVHVPQGEGWRFLLRKMQCSALGEDRPLPDRLNN